MNKDYKLHHPAWYRRQMQIFWWLKRFSYTKFISRELTSLAVGWSAIMLIALLWAAGHGAPAFDRFLTLMSSTSLVVLNIVAAIALLFHTLTWLHLAPKAMVVQIGRYRVPDRLLLIGQYLSWAAATALVVWYFGGSR